ncbi:MAG: tetratricopeptide repeat protein [Steroidobacteraceae bacterium]|jgi:Flp pilus assembly protein TadD|nr:tetratricopeptide repeat protein [Steroidobacteraceae bacterium]
MNTQAELAQATALLQRRQLAAAEAACRRVLANAPRNAAAIHLLGLICKDAGRLEDGERLLRESIALEPRQAEFRSNLGNLLRRTGRLREAIATYREALEIDPGRRSARVALARTLNDLKEHRAAESQARILLSKDQRDAIAWSTLAMALRDQQRLIEAEAAYRQALLLAPQDARTHHNLGSVLARMDRAEEALSALERAGALGVQGFELAFNRAIALLQLYRIDEAERAFAEAVQIQPLNAEAQINLARLRYMRGDPDFTRDIAAAAAARGDDAGLRCLLSQVLRRAGDVRGAEQLLREFARRSTPTPHVRAALAETLLEAGRFEEAHAEARQAAAALPDDSGVSDVLVTILLCMGRPEEALPLIRAQRLRHPQSQGWIAYEATAARLLGDPLYGQLYDYDRLIRTYQVEPPAGWSSMADLNAAALDALQARHRFTNHPLDQSLRNGSQTARSLLADPDPCIQALLQAFQEPIEAYVHEMGADPQHALSARNRGAAAISGAWSVQLRREGFHVNHVHPQGWISSAYYVAVPQEAQDEQLRSGWLKFGETRYPTPGAAAERFVQPQPGKLVLFPSYMWHGTNPIHGDELRTTVAFDALPGRRKDGKT